MNIPPLLRRAGALFGATMALTGSAVKPAQADPDIVDKYTRQTIRDAFHGNPRAVAQDGEALLEALHDNNEKFLWVYTNKVAASPASSQYDSQQLLTRIQWPDNKRITQLIQDAVAGDATLVNQNRETLSEQMDGLTNAGILAMLAEASSTLKPARESYATDAQWRLTVADLPREPQIDQTISDTLSGNSSAAVQESQVLSQQYFADNNALIAKTIFDASSGNSVAAAFDGDAVGRRLGHLERLFTGTMYTATTDYTLFTNLAKQASNPDDAKTLTMQATGSRGFAGDAELLTEWLLDRQADAVFQQPLAALTNDAKLGGLNQPTPNKLLPDAIGFLRAVSSLKLSNE